MVRKIRVPKVRGQAPQPGLHTVRIDESGLQIFPRMIKPIEGAQDKLPTRFISTGNKGLDEMMGGGTLTGNTLLVAGPFRCGKNTTAIQFFAVGGEQKEPRGIANFEETTQKYVDQARGVGIHLGKRSRQRKL